jgi:WS/DGAT/MGAT family acyltransferase
MQKLGALDANFLYTETDRTPNHVSSVQIFELPDNCAIDEFVLGLKTFFMQRIHLVPYLTRVLRFVPGNIDHPVWIKDKAFNVDNHFTLVELPAPGTFEQLEQKVADIHAELMDRSKPLWHLYLITGLEDGRIAYYNQAHHACIDGMAGQAATMIMMDTTPELPEIPAPQVSNEVEGGLGELFRLSFENFLKFQIEGPSRILGNVDAMVRLTSRAIDPRRSMGTTGRSAPSTRFNKVVHKERAYAAGDMSVADLKAMGKAANCKLNDIFLAACAGGLRRYLDSSNELPRTSLIAGCPVSLRKPGDTSMDNQVTMMSVALATDIRDPMLRLQAIIDSSKLAKELVSDTAGAFNPEVSLYGLPNLVTTGTRVAEFLRAANTAPAVMNLVISNVPGPRETLYSNGAKMLTHYPVSIPTHGQGLNITATSYVDRLYFSITACAVAVPDAAKLRNDIMTAYHELLSLLLPGQNKVAELKTRQEDILSSPNQALLQAETQDELRKAS